jgi:hypothetical protein
MSTVTETPPPATIEPKLVKTARRWTWKRRLRVGAIVLFIGVIAFRLLLHILLPVAIARTGRLLGYRISYERLQLDVIGTNAALWGVDIKTRDGAQQVLKTDYAYANISTLALFGLRLKALRLEADEVALDVVRKPDGSIPLLDALQSAPSKPTPGAGPQDVNFKVPLEVSAIRLHRLALHVRDETVSPPFDHTFRTDLGMSNVGHPGTPATLDIETTTDSFFDAMRVTGEATTTPTSLESSFAFSLRGVHAGALTTYVQDLGISAEDRDLNVLASGAVSLAAIPGSPGQVSGSISLNTIGVRSEGETTAALKTLDIQIASLSPSALHVKKVLIDQGLLRADRMPDGRFRIAPLVLGAAENSKPATAQAPRPPAQAPPSPAQPSPPAVAKATAPPASGGSPFSVKVDECAVTGVGLELVDRAVNPTNTVSLKVDRVLANNIATEGSPDSAVTLTASMSMPGLLASLSADAEATPFASPPAGKFTVAIDGIRPDVLNPYLKALGLSNAIESGTFKLEGTASVDAKQDSMAAMSLAVANLSLKDGETELVSLPSFSIGGLAFDPKGGIQIASIEGSGPVCTIKRLTDGTIGLPGLRVVGAPKPPATATAATPSSPSKASEGTANLPPLRIAKLKWGGTKIRFEDKSVPNAAPTEIADAGVDIEGLVVDLRPDAPAASPGSLHAWITSPGLANKIDFRGSLSPGAGGLGTKITGTGEGLDLAKLAPYLKPLGIEPTLQKGSFALGLEASIKNTADSLHASVDVTNAKLMDGSETLGSAAKFSADVDLGASKIALGKVVVDGAQTSVSRGADGSIQALGVRILPIPESAKTDVPFPDIFGIISSLGEISVEDVDAQNVQVAWADQAARKPVKTKLKLEAKVGALAINKPGSQPGPFEVEIAGDGIAGKLHASGNLGIGADSLTLDAATVGEDLAGEVIAAYLPAEAEPRIKKGKLLAKVHAQVAKAPPSGYSARLDVSGVDWSDSGTTLLHVGKFSLDVGSLNPDTLDTSVRKIEASGLSGSLGRNADGTLDAFGFALGGGTPDPKPAQPQPAAAADVRAIVAGSQAAAPLLSFDQLDMRIDKISFTDRARPEAASVSIVNAHAYTKAPARLLGAKPETNPPIAIVFDAGVEPVISKASVELETKPFAQQPKLSIKVAVDGIDGEGIAKIAPELKEYIGAADLKGARFATSVDAEATVRRRGPTQIDLSHGVDLAFAVNDTKLTAGDGTVLGGVAKIQGEGVKIDANTGGVTAKSVDVSNLAALAWRDEAGIHALGGLLKLPADAIQVKVGEPEIVKPGDTPQSEPAKPPEPEKPASAPELQAKPGEAAPSTPEFRIDRLTVSGLDFRFEDRALKPPVVIPINALDADIRGLSSRALTQDQPIKFNASAGAGKVSLPKPMHGGLLARGSAASSEAEPELEDRDFFSQCIASGNLSLYPAIHGRANASISGVELTALRGLADAAGASVGGGVFDARVDARSVDENKLEVRCRLVLTDLKYSEPDNGPVGRKLHLSVPLDTAIAAVEAPDKSITLPVNFPLTSKGLSSGDIVSAATGAVASVLATAIASAPVKVVSGFAGLFADTKKEAKWVEEPPITLSYVPGVSTLDEESRTKLIEVLSRAKTDKRVQVAISHEMGTADAALCASRANPPAQVALGLAESLRDGRKELLERRTLLLPFAQTQSVRGDPEPTALFELRDIQLRLAQVDDAMDRLYDLTRRGAERNAGRRTRAGCLELADGRLNVIRRDLATIGGPAATSRTGIAVPRGDIGESEESHLVIHVRHKG